MFDFKGKADQHPRAGAHENWALPVGKGLSIVFLVVCLALALAAVFVVGLKLFFWLAVSMD
ncbi:hypothetical protein [Actinoplanes xinjiangensis]|uniref:hypothetical protein n=1 Tax=Actinoplanes xinjiangensis TaxID=512350 RepID=UPI000D6B1FE7|nr:hypothetical protein [Actinoplanes xinjiangensis]